MHHAYLLVGDPKEAEAYLRAFWNERGMELSGSPDYFVYKGELFGIEDARSLSDYAQRKAFIERKIFFIAPERMSREAQNALLKTFEDPIENTHFFLVSREEELIIPTLRSRMQTLHVQHSVLNNEAEKFLSLSLKDRLNFAAKFADAGENLSAFLDKLMLLLKKTGKLDSVKCVYEARKYSDDRAAAPRLILEHLALVL